jgi:hypothetical protein
LQQFGNGQAPLVGKIDLNDVASKAVCCELNDLVFINDESTISGYNKRNKICKGWTSTLSIQRGNFHCSSQKQSLKGVHKLKVVDNIVIPCSKSSLSDGGVSMIHERKYKSGRQNAIYSNRSAARRALLLSAATSHGQAVNWVHDVFKKMNGESQELQVGQYGILLLYPPIQDMRSAYGGNSVYAVVQRTADSYMFTNFTDRFASRINSRFKLF